MTNQINVWCDHLLPQYMQKLPNALKTPIFLRCHMGYVSIVFGGPELVLVGCWLEGLN